MTARLTVAVASGKGGTGKTTVSANLALVAAARGSKVTYLDCDVEEPNGHLFLKPVFGSRRPVYLPVPLVDQKKCVSCGACGQICQYGAIISLPREVLTFEKMCHGCGGCTLVCPAGAITETGREIGALEEGRAGRIDFVHGRLMVGEAMSPPLIKAVLSAGPRDSFRLLDAPPGTSCPVVTAVRGADYVLLVTEPTPFGLHDLELALDMVKELDVPHGVVVNRSLPQNRLAREFCEARGVRILAEIPDDRRVAEAYSRGELAFSAVPGFRECFEDLLTSLKEEVGW